MVKNLMMNEKKESKEEEHRNKQKEEKMVKNQLKALTLGEKGNTRIAWNRRLMHTKGVSWQMRRINVSF